MPQLGLNQVDVWLFEDDGSVDRGALLWELDQEEIARYSDFQNQAAARRFACGRALVRAALSSYANVPERAWKFSFNRYGRPEIDLPISYRGIQFNISHTTRFIAVAVARNLEIGIDIESLDRSVDVEWISRSVFTPAESHWVASGATESINLRFFELWTLKEAYIKAKGLGFNLPPKSFGLANLEGRIVLECSSECDPNPGRWQFQSSSPHPGLKLALVFCGRPDTEVRVRNWDGPSVVSRNSKSRVS